MLEHDVLDSGLGDLGLLKALRRIKINLKPPKKIRVRLGPVKVTVTRKDWGRGPVTGALIASGPAGWGALYAAYKGRIPGVRLSERDKAFVREKAKIAAASTAAVAAAAAAPVVLPAVASGAGSAAGMVAKGASAAAPLLVKTGKAAVKVAKSEPVQAFVKGVQEGAKKSGTSRESEPSPRLQRAQPTLPRSRTPSQNTGMIWILAGLALLMLSGRK